MRRRLRRPPLMKAKNRKKSRTDRPTLPELDQTKKSVLNSLTSMQSRRSYQHAMDEFIDWYCSEPRLALNRDVVLRYRLQLEAKKLAACSAHYRSSDKYCGQTRRLTIQTGVIESPQWNAFP